MTVIYGLSYGAIRGAMEVLRKHGLITTIYGRGTFVSARAGSKLIRYPKGSARPA